MFVIKMRWFIMFITVVCVLLLIKLRRPKNKGLYKTKQNQMKIDFINFKKNIVEDSLEIKLLLNNNMENINFQLHAQESPPLPLPSFVDGYLLFSPISSCSLFTYKYNITGHCQFQKGIKPAILGDFNGHCQNCYLYYRK